MTAGSRRRVHRDRHRRRRGARRARRPVRQPQPGRAREGRRRQRASTPGSTDHALAGSPLADYGVDGVDNAMFGTGSPASSASRPRSPSAPASCWMRPPAARPLGAAGGRTLDCMGGAHRHLLLHDEGPLHRLPPQCKLAGDACCSCSPSWPRRRSSSGRSASTPRSSSLAALIGRVPLLVVARRLVIEVPFLLFAVLLPIVGRGPRVDVLGLQPVRARAVGGVEHRRQGHARRRRHRRAGLDDVDPAHPRRPRAAARAADAGGDHRVHDPLRRRHRRRGAADAHRPGVARCRRRAASARRAPSPPRPARCSCARTSAASGCTWRWRRAGYAGIDAGARARRRRRGRGWCACCGRLAAALVAVAALEGAAMTAPALEVRDLAFAYPDGHEALRGVDLTVDGRRAGRHPRPERRRQDDARARPQRHQRGRAAARSPSAGCPSRRRNLPEIRRRVGIVFQDPDDQLFMPTVRDDVAFGPANLGLRGAELDAADDRGARRRRHGPRRRPLAAPPQLRRAPPGRPGHRAGDAPRRPRARRAVVEPRPGGPARAGRDRARARRHDVLVTHDLPYALQLCERAVVLDDGRVVVDGPTRDVLADRDDDGRPPPGAAVRLRSRDAS